MMYILLALGLALPTCIGWLTLRIIEGKTAVLFSVERVIAGFALGSIIVPFVLFFTEVSGIGSFSLAAMVATQVVLLAALFSIYCVRKKSYSTSPIPGNDEPWLLWQKIVAVVLGLWFFVKTAAAWLLLMGPSFFDDTVKNWNLRGKMFYVQQEFTFNAIPGKDVGIGSYPPTVPLMKTWLAAVNGGWDETVVNAIHMLWFLAAIALMYFVLRRIMSSAWSALGAYLLSSLPLYLMHGGAAYADQFLSLIIFIAVSWLYLGLRSEAPMRSSFLQIAAVTTGLLVFTKNEALLLHLPPLGLIVGCALLMNTLSTAEKRQTALWYGFSVLLVAIPWLTFKWLHNLTFGNAKSATGMVTLEWHDLVLETIFESTFFMGHWLLLPVLFVGTLIVCRKVAFRTPLVVCTAFFLIVWLGQIPLYLFSELYIEATNQTGYARGVLHLIPLAVLVTVVCLHEKISSHTNNSSQKT